MSALLRTRYGVGPSLHPLWLLVQSGYFQRKLAHVCGVLSAVGMLVLIKMAISPSQDDWLADAITTGLFCGAAGVAGSAFGWVLGAFVCEI